MPRRSRMLWRGFASTDTCDDTGRATPTFEDASGRELSRCVHAHRATPSIRDPCLLPCRPRRRRCRRPSLSPDAKLALLDLFEATLTGRNIRSKAHQTGSSRQPAPDVRELQRGRGGIPIFKLRAPIRSKPIFDACSECPADPFIGARTFKFARKAADNAK